jgi:predicted Zn-dependent peptidase
MLTEAIGSRDNKQLTDLTEGLGLQLGASSGPIQASVSCSGLSESTDVLIGLLADALLRPAFPQERLDRLQQNERSQGGRRPSNPTGLIAGLQARVFYKGTPLQRVVPKPEELRSIKRDDVVAYHAAFYRPGGAILGVTGDIRAGDLKRKLDKALADWKPANTTPAPPSVTVAPKEKTTVYLVDRPGSTQTALGFGNIAIARNHPDYVPLVLANRILGGGSAARLFQNIRERKGYTYGAYSSLSATQYAGTWTASASIRTEVTAMAAQEFLNEFARLQDEPVSERELAQAKTSIVGGFALTLESPDGILGRSLELVNNGLPANYWDTYPAKVQAVTPADIQRVARTYLGKGRVQIFAVGERSEIEAGLAKLGPVEVVDAAQISAPAGPGGGRRGP